MWHVIVLQMIHYEAQIVLFNTSAHLLPPAVKGWLLSYVNIPLPFPYLNIPIVCLSIQMATLIKYFIHQLQKVLIAAALQITCGILYVG
jgi:hypothetical protein